MKKIAIIYSNYYPEITAGLINAFKDSFKIKVEFAEFEVFGVSEIPYKFSELSDIDGVAVFGCVLEGETYHHELINNFVFNSLYEMSINRKLPLGYGILNVKTLDQAYARSVLDSENNRGLEAYMALSKLVDFS